MLLVLAWQMSGGTCVCCAGIAIHLNVLRLQVLLRWSTLCRYAIATKSLVLGTSNSQHDLSSNFLQGGLSLPSLWGVYRHFFWYDTTSIPLNSICTQPYTAKYIPRASIHRHGLISISTSCDLSSALHEFARQALQYYIILDGWLSRDTMSCVLRGGYAYVYIGTLSLERKGAVVTTVDGSSRGPEKVLKVKSLLNKNSSTSL